eukprot:3629433-Amphidinium_carterae.1
MGELALNVPLHANWGRNVHLFPPASTCAASSTTACSFGAVGAQLGHGLLQARFVAPAPERREE